MYPEQQVAFIQSQIVCAQSEIAAMQAENLLEPGKWKGQDFRDVPLRFGLDHNAVVSFFTGR